MFVNGWPMPYPGASTRVEHYHGVGLEWMPFWDQTNFDSWTFRETIAAPRRYRAGQRHVERWNQPPFGPSLAPQLEDSVAARAGDALILDPSMVSDAADRWTLCSSAHRRAALYRDGQLVAERIDEPVARPFDVPPGPATFRFEREEIPDLTGSELSTRVAAAWTFRSRHAGGTAPVDLPLLGLRFTPALDDQGAARRGAPILLPLAFERPGGAPAPAVTHLDVDASFDDGAAWSRVQVFRLLGRWYGIVHHPGDGEAGYVSLRAAATDAEGSRVEQTIIRAYRLK
jgi:hypothetical protein